MTDFLQEAQALFPFTQSMRRDFHQNPELGYQETRTAGIVAKELTDLGLEVTTGVAKTGVVALLEGAKSDPVLMLRFEMDALPIVEETGVTYASQNKGVMHACGHDGHTAIGLTVARLLQEHRDQLAGTVKFVFQPSEEGLCGEDKGGAEMMIAEGVLEDPQPEAILAMHLWNEKPLGWLGIAGGPIMAGAEDFKVRLTGKGGHAAVPHQTIDPVLAAAQIITALQSITSRNVAPLQTAVVSVTMVHGGEAFNVIPPEVTLKGTVRTFELSVREKVLRRFDEIVYGVAEAMGCQAEIEMLRVAPALINDEQMTQRIQSIAGQLLPEAMIGSEGYFTMGAEDAAFFLEKVKGCYFFVGSANSEKGLDYGHHHPKFDFDEAALPRAVALIASAAAEFLRNT
jgi:amidohydrolase